MDTQDRRSLPGIPLSSAGLSANALKLIAVFAMLIDHLGWAFVDTFSIFGQTIHVIGRITAPIMCFFIAEGYFYTRNVKRYALRLGLFALVSQLPFTFFETGRLGIRVGPAQFNMIFTLLCSLLAVWAWDKLQNRALRFLALLGLCAVAMLGDWMCFAVLFTLAFAINRDNFRMQVLWSGAVMVLAAVFLCLLSGPGFYQQLFQFGTLLSLPLLWLYNGRKGGGRYSKWIFYIFYPAHLLVLGLIRLWLLTHGLL